MEVFDSININEETKGRLSNLNKEEIDVIMGSDFKEEFNGYIFL